MGKEAHITRRDFLKFSALAALDRSVIKKINFGPGDPISAFIPSPTELPTIEPEEEFAYQPENEINPPVGGFIYKGNAENPNVALTFDDGWLAPEIKKFIKVVEKYDLKLTLFPVGQAIEANPNLWKELYRLGCDLECHSYTHDFNLHLRDSKTILSEINRSQQALNKAIGEEAPFRYFRPPGGATSRNLSETLKSAGLKGIIWSVSSFGTDPNATSQSVRDRILTVADNGAIILHHFINSDVSAFEEIVVGLKEKEFNITNLSQTLKL